MVRPEKTQMNFQSLSHNIRLGWARAGILLCAVFLTAAAGRPDSVEITTTNAYGITSFLKKEHPELTWFWQRGLRKLSDKYSVADVIAQNSEVGWQSMIYGFFLVNTSSNTLVKPIVVLRSDAETVDLADSGRDHITVLQQSMYGIDLARDTYFFDMSPDSPATKYPAKTINISAIEPSAPDIFFGGAVDKDGIIIRAPIQGPRIDVDKSEILTEIGETKISPVILAKGEGSLLRMYSPEAIYVFNGKSWAALNKASEKYFRSADPCADIPFEKLAAISSTAYMAGYDRCERQRYENGDAWRVGYVGKCETDPPDRNAGLPSGYDGIFERWEMPSHIIELSSAPLHRFLVWNSQRNAHGIYEIETDKCRFYPMPSPDKATLTRFRPGDSAFTINNGLGSFQELDGRIWLCPDFYDSEGYTGLGGIGYFDMKERKYEVFYSSKTSGWGCSTLMAEKGKVWIGLLHRPEGTPGSGGLAAYDISSGEFSAYDIPAVINVVRRVGDSLFMGTQNGIYTLSADGKVSFLGPRLDKDGKYQLRHED